MFTPEHQPCETTTTLMVEKSSSGPRRRCENFAVLCHARRKPLFPTFPPPAWANKGRQPLAVLGQKGRKPLFPTSPSHLAEQGAATPCGSLPKYEETVSPHFFPSRVAEQGAATPCGCRPKGADTAFPHFSSSRLVEQGRQPFAGHCHTWRKPLFPLFPLPFGRTRGGNPLRFSVKVGGNQFSQLVPLAWPNKGRLPFAVFCHSGRKQIFPSAPPPA